jgi:hypothetical protein
MAHCSLEDSMDSEGLFQLRAQISVFPDSSRSRWKFSVQTSMNATLHTALAALYIQIFGSAPIQSTAELTSSLAYPKAMYFQSLYLVRAPTLFLVSSLPLPIETTLDLSGICCLSPAPPPLPPNCSWFNPYPANVEIMVSSYRC